MSAAPATLRRRLARPLALAALLAAGLGACSDSTGPRPPLEGDWISPGAPAAVPTDATITLRLRQDGSDVTGSGTMTYPGTFANALAVEGTVSGSVVILTFTSPALGEQPMTMQAILAENGRTFTGTLTLGQSSATARQRTFER